MQPTKTRDKTITFKKPENWDDKRDGSCGDLEVRVGEHGENRLITLTSTWKPTAFELGMLAAGGMIEVMIISASQPPMSVAVVAPTVEVIDPKGRLPTLEIDESGVGTYDEHGPATP